MKIAGLALIIVTLNNYGKCQGQWLNPLTDICWECIFPLTIGSVTVVKSGYPDTENPSSPISICPAPPPLFFQTGVNIGYWEPAFIADVTRTPWCMVSMGMQLLGMSMAGGEQMDHETETSYGFYHAHWYRYPIIAWLQIMQNANCMTAEPFELLYMTELDPLWNDDALAFVLDPEAILFGRLDLQNSCATEAMQLSLGKLPIDKLFWCLGAQGSAYPLTGNLGYHFTPLQSLVLINERLNYKLHRQSMMLESSGNSGSICNLRPAPFLPKSRYRYQLISPVNQKNCYPYGTSTVNFANEKQPIGKGGYGGFINYRKRNCVFF